jgi:hypothetical protein
MLQCCTGPICEQVQDMLLTRVHVSRSMDMLQCCTGPICEQVQDMLHQDHM